MRHDRLQALTDGIFAIVMTLLVLDLKVPLLSSHENGSLFQALMNQSTVFVSYLISFAVLFLFWRAHSFVVSIVAKNLDITLLNINALFLFFVGLVPFTTHILGIYGDTQMGIGVYSLNIIAIGLTVVWMRLYVEKAESIETDVRTREQLVGALIRTLIPIVFSAIAIPVSFLSTRVAFLLLIVSVAYNFYPNASDLTRRILGKRVMHRVFGV